MHALLRTAAVATIFFVAASAIARAQDSQGTGDAKAAAGQAAVTQQDAQGQQAAQAHDGNQSRYRRHNGRWWYWTHNNNWVVWHNNAWAPYTAGMFAGERATVSRQPVRRYSYDPVQGNYSPRIYRAPRAFGDSRSIRYAGSKINADYAPYTGGSMQ